MYKDYNNPHPITERDYGIMIVYLLLHYYNNSNTNGTFHENAVAKFDKYLFIFSQTKRNEPFTDNGHCLEVCVILLTHLS